MACGNNMVSRDGLQSAPAGFVGPTASAPLAPRLDAHELAAVAQRVERGIEQAASLARTATDPSVAAQAVKEAQKAVDDARRARGLDRNQRAALVRGAERRLDQIRRDAGRVRPDSEGSPASLGNGQSLLSLAEFVTRVQDADRLSRTLLGVPEQLTGPYASSADRELAEGWGKVAAKPLNSRYAGKRFPLENARPDLAVKYPQSVRFTAQGYPDFSPYAVAKVELDELAWSNDSKEYAHIDRLQDFKAADDKVGIKAPERTARRLTWHHVEDGRTLLLVPADLHNAVSHHGGVAYTERVAGPQGLIANYAVDALRRLDD